MSSSAPAVPEIPTSQSQVALADSPTKAEVLAYLDWEIQNIREQEKLVGASTWSLTLALGAVLWLLLSESRSSWAELPALLYLICGFSLIQDFLTNAYFSAREKVPEPTLVRRVVRMSSVLGSRRRQILYFLLRGLCLLVALALLPGYVSGAVRWTIGVWLALQMLLMVFAFFIGSFDIELPEPEKKETSSKVKLRNFFLAALGWTFPLALTLIYWRPVFALHLTFRPEDYKTSLLVIVATFLTSLVLETRLRAEIAPALIALRRDLALGAMSHEDAAQHASYVVSGLTAEAYVRREFLKHEQLLQKSQNALQRLNENLRGLENGLASGANYDKEKVRTYLTDNTPFLDLLDKLDGNVAGFKLKLGFLPEGPIRRQFEEKAGVLEEGVRTGRETGRSHIRRILELVNQPSPPPPTATTH